MIRLLLLIVISGCLGCLSWPKAQTIPSTPPSAVNSVLDATVSLVHEGTYTIYCSGIIHEGLVITANHCSTGQDTIFVHTFMSYHGKSEAVKMAVAYLDEVNDLAILIPISAKLGRGRPIASKAPVWGQKVITVGSPMGLGWTITDGIVSHPRREGGINQSAVWMHMSAPVYFGNSGGPVLNGYGEIVGTLSFMIGRVPHLAGVVHHSTIVSALKKMEVE